MQIIRTHRDIREGCTALAASDPMLARAIETAGPPPLRRRPGGFEALLQSIMGQQLSVASANAIWNRLAEACGHISPERVLELSDEECRTAGLSRQKMNYSRELAAAVAEGRLKFRSLSRMPDEEAIATLTEVKGVGRWTAEMYLMFALGRRDIWPVDDLAVVEAVRRLKGLEARPGRKEMAVIGEAWRPWRSVAARLMWHFYRKIPPGEW